MSVDRRISERKNDTACGPAGAMKDDYPVEERKQDKLGRFPVAEDLVRDLYYSATDRHAFVVGLLAPWGWGKTSFLKFMQNSAKSLPHDPDRPEPVVINFNPWWFSRREDLFSRFLLEISHQAKRELEDAQDKKHLLDTLDQLFTVVHESIPLPLAGGLKALLTGLKKGQKRNFEKAKALTTLHKHACEELARAKYQLWVFIDDIDRLEPKEAIHFLALIRLMADLPWTRYFLAYDQDSLHRLLTQALFPDQKTDDAEKAVRDYMDKIVQVEIRLPQLVDREPGPPVAEPEEPSEAESAGGAPPQAGAVKVDFPDPVRRYAEVQFAAGFGEDLDAVAWVRTYVEGTKPSIRQIDTPRTYVRWYNRRRLLHLFDPATLVRDVQTISEAIRADTQIDYLFTPRAPSRAQPTPQQMSQAIYERLCEAKINDVVARQLAYSFIGAMAGRLRFRPASPKEAKHAKIEEFIGSEDQTIEKETVEEGKTK